MGPKRQKSWGRSAVLGALLSALCSSAPEVAEVPAAVVTVTSTVPGEPAAGAVAVSEVALATLNELVGTLPKQTAAGTYELKDHNPITARTWC
jgi:hypothetical protein